MNKKEVRKHRRALTWFVIVYIFCILIISVLITFIAMKTLLKLDIIPIVIDKKPDPKYILLFMLLINVVIGFILITLTSRITLQYVNRMINQMNRLASGDFKARLNYGEPMSKHPTVVEVTNSFNKMAEELENTELLRNDFINNFSHEFKTPIVSIAGFAKLLKHGNLSEEQRKEYIDIIEEESMRLATMATNVLNLTKVENQTILTNVTVFNLSEQLRNCVLLLEPRWTQRNIDFNIEFDEHIIMANEELLKQVWINLIDNAIKYSIDYGTVKISVEEREKTIAVSVLNVGSEIPVEQQKRIFNKFYQVDESHASEGNGIGLALVKHIVELHNGAVSVTSGQNTTIFTVELPKEQ